MFIEVQILDSRLRGNDEWSQWNDGVIPLRTFAPPLPPLHSLHSLHSLHY